MAVPEAIPVDESMTDKLDEAIHTSEQEAVDTQTEEKT